MTVLRYERGYGNGGALHADTNHYFEVSLIIDSLFATLRPPKASSLKSLEDHASTLSKFIDLAKLYEEYKELASQLAKDREKLRAATVLEFDTEQYERFVAETQEEFLLKSGVLVKELLKFNGVTEVDSKPTSRLY